MTNKEGTPNMEQHILLCAEQLFLKKGFALTTTTAIAKEAGCNQALIHYYFRTKENLFQRIFEEKVKAFFHSLQTTAVAELPFEQKVKQIAGTHFDMLAKNPGVPLLVINEVMTNPQRAEAIREFVFGILGGFAQQLERELKIEIERGTVRPISFLDFIWNIGSLNIFSFILLPMMVKLEGITPAESETFLLHRKQEVITSVWNSIKA